MTVFATPDGHPFFCGTYYPREAFVRLVRAVAEAWQDQRERGLAQGAAVVEAVAEAQGVPDRRRPRSCSTPPLLDSAAASLHRDYDPTYGGFGGAPKFPPHMALLFLLRHHQRTGDADLAGGRSAHRRGDGPRAGCTTSSPAGSPATASTSGGWCRTSRRCSTTTPCCCGSTPSCGGSPATRWRCGWPARRSPFCGRDLHAGGLRVLTGRGHRRAVEGSTYVWTPAQLREVLGDADGAWAADLLSVTDGRDVRARHERAAAGPRHRRRRHPRSSRAGQAARAALLAGPGAAAPAGPRRQGGRRLGGLAVTALAEYATLRRGPRRGRGCRGWPARPGEYLADGAPGRRPGAPRVPRRRGGPARRRARRLRLPGRGVRRPAPAHRRGRWLDLAGGCWTPALEHFGDGEGGFFDTADDAEAAGRPAGRPDRQRDARPAARR